MRIGRILLFVVAILASPSAIASTELRADSGFLGDLSRAAPLDARDDSSALEALAVGRGAPFAGDVAENDSALVAVNGSLFERREAPPSHAAKNDRFIWVVPLIAFAGLSALFARKRSGGRGLIAV